MPNYPFNLSSSALIVIDMQNAFLDPKFPLAVPDALATVEKVNRLVNVCRESDIPVIWTSHVLESDLRDKGLLTYSPLTESDLQASFADGGEGVKIYSELDWRPEEFTIKKNRFSAFYKTELEEILAANNIDTLIVAGTILNVCCESTVRDAFFRDIKVFLPVDINSAVDHPDVGFGSYTAEQISNAVYTSLGRRFAHIVTTDEMINEIKKKGLTIKK